MENILLPTTIEFRETDNQNVGKMVVTPCHQGYGTTSGNALRRVLLSSLPGAAVESIKIKGVQHEFSALDGVQEDVIEIILNIKHLAVKSFSSEPVVLSLTKKGKGEVTAADFDKNSDIEIVSPDLKICTVTDDNFVFDMDITINQGRGYVAVAEKETKNLDLGTIAIDSLYTPIRDVGYNVENTRVGDVTDYEKLTLVIETNGTITPRAAVAQATKILMDHFTLILEQTGASDRSSEKQGADASPEEEAKSKKPKTKKKSTKKKKEDKK